jgi:hypothetical protein
LATRISRRALPLLLLLTGAGCGETLPVSTPPLDRFYFPTGVAVRHEPAGCVPGGAAPCQSQLLVASSNFDLRYDPATGGTIIAVDVDKAIGPYLNTPGNPLEPLTANNGLLGATQVGSFAGELAVVDATTCPGWSGANQALVTSRSTLSLYRVDVGAAGALSCGTQCKVPLESSFGDPYGVTVACGDFPSASGAALHLAFVTYLRAPNSEGWLSPFDLDSGTRLAPIDVGTDPTHSTVFDPVSTRLYIAEVFASILYTPFRWITLASPSTPAVSVNVDDTVRGSELRGIALSSDGTRAYLALRLYDITAATTGGARPVGDVGGALAVMDLTETPQGGPAATIINVVPIARGATQIRAIPRPGHRDLVAVTNTDDDSLTLYDDDSGLVANVFGRCGTSLSGSDPTPPCGPSQVGEPMLGEQPFGLAFETRSGGTVRLFVGSFDRFWVNVIDIDPLHPEAKPIQWARIGVESTTAPRVNSFP